MNKEYFYIIYMGLHLAQAPIELNKLTANKNLLGLNEKQLKLLKVAILNPESLSTLTKYEQTIANEIIYAIHFYQQALNQLIVQTNQTLISHASNSVGLFNKDSAAQRKPRKRSRHKRGGKKRTQTRKLSCH